MRILFGDLVDFWDWQGGPGEKRWTWPFPWWPNYPKKSGIMGNGVKVEAKDALTQGTFLSLRQSRAGQKNPKKS